MTRTSRPGVLGAAGLALLSGLVFLLGTPYANGSLTARITNGNDTAASAIYTTGTCTATTTANGLGAYFVYPLSEAVGLTTAADVSGNLLRNGTYSTSGITYGAPGPCPRDGNRAVTLDGANGSITGPAASQTGPTTFSVSIWFRTTSAQGKLIGFGSSATGSSGSYDRHLYLDTGGRVVFGVYPNAVKTVTSPMSYTDGAWHQAVATLAGSGTSAGMRLYVDGQLVGSDNNATAQSFNGFWRIGYDNLGSWTNQPASFYFKGSLAYAAVFTTALTPAQVLTQYRAGS